MITDNRERWPSSLPEIMLMLMYILWISGKKVCTSDMHVVSMWQSILAYTLEGSGDHLSFQADEHKYTYSVGWMSENICVLYLPLIRHPFAKT